jgi:heterotetrameric sarcosine oxidase delta subunit
MLLIACPHCGPRNSAEFRYLGEKRARPEPVGATPEEWRAYLYRRSNPAGWTTENWCHATGCRAFLVLERHTGTNEVRSIALAGGEP